MTRYQALRKMEVDWFTSGFIAFANFSELPMRQ